LDDLEREIIISGAMTGADYVNLKILAIDYLPIKLVPRLERGRKWAVGDVGKLHGLEKEAVFTLFSGEPGFCSLAVEGDYLKLSRNKLAKTDLTSMASDFDHFKDSARRSRWKQACEKTARSGSRERCKGIAGG